MTALPPDTEINNAASEAAAKAWFSAVRNYLSGVLGVAGDKIYQDQITEATPGAGVTIDGVLIKDGAVVLGAGQALAPLGGGTGLALDGATGGQLLAVNGTGDGYELIDSTALGRSLLAAANAEAARTVLEIEASAEALLVANNLSDLDDPAEARVNLGLSACSEPYTDLGSGTSLVLDGEGNSALALVMTGTTTIAHDNLSAGRVYRFYIRLSQDATGGRAATLPSGTVVAYGEAPTWPTAANAWCKFVLETWDAGTSWELAWVGAEYE